MAFYSGWMFWGLFVACLAICVACFYQRLRRIYNMLALFWHSTIAHNFRSMHTIGFPSVPISTRGAPIAQLDTAADAPGLPKTFEFKGTTMDLPGWMKDHWTTGLVVIKRDSTTKARVLHEAYDLGNDVNSRCVSWSMCKSIVSTLFGIAVDKGIIGDIDSETVTDYVPELKGCGYEGVTLKNLLQMSSGVAFNEDYFNPCSDIYIMGAFIFAFGWSMDWFVSRFKRGPHEQGTFNQYVSIDTQVLAMVLSRAAKSSLSAFLEEHLWSKVGFESNAIWCMDNERHRRELAFGILEVTARDWARFGWLMLNGGLSPATGERLVSERWVQAATTPDAPHLMPGEANTQSDYSFFGYAFQWWVGPREDDPNLPADDFLAIGVYGQMIYVSREYGVVVAKTAAFPDFEKTQLPGTSENLLETQGFCALRAIAKHYATS